MTDFTDKNNETRGVMCDITPHKIYDYGGFIVKVQNLENHLNLFFFFWV